MEKHPLQYFIDLIEGKRIADLRHSFLTVNPHLSVTHINMQEEFIMYIEDDIHNRGRVEDTLYFKHFLKGLLLEKKAEILGNIDLYMLKNLDAKQQVLFVSQISITIVELIRSIEQYEEAKKYPIIETILSEIQETLRRKNGVNGENNIVEDSTKKKDIKLQWKGKINLLTTLFYDLIHENKAKDIPMLINATPKEMEDFIMNHFVDGNTGEPFSRGTVNTNLKNSKQTQKRAKGEISIEIMKN